MLREYLLIAFAGALGALSRYSLGAFLRARASSPFPAGTLLINVTGSFLLGVVSVYGLARIAISPSYRTAITVGFIGAYTTFSTWSMETVSLLQAGHHLLAFANTACSVVGGLFAAWLGVVVGRAL